MLTFANVVSSLALLVALSGGVAYAANTIMSTDIVDGQVKRVDLAANSVGSQKVIDETLTGADIKNNTLSNKDVGVFYADIAPNANVVRSSAGVTASKGGTGVYVVDFGRVITDCSPVATVGYYLPVISSGQVTVSPYTTSTNFLVLGFKADGSGATDLPFHIVVVC
jgi:hypothetical protein